MDAFLDLSFPPDVHFFLRSVNPRFSKFKSAFLPKPRFSHDHRCLIHSDRIARPLPPLSQLSTRVFWTRDVLSSFPLPSSICDLFSPPTTLVRYLLPVSKVTMAVIEGDSL